MKGAEDEEEPTAIPSIPAVVLQSLRELRPLSTRELVQALIDYANDGSASAAAVLASGTEMSKSTLALLPYVGEPPTGYCGPEQLQLREALGMVLNGDVPAAVVASWRRRRAGLLFLHEPGEGTVRYRYAAFERWPSPPSPSVAYALCVLHEGEFRGELCRCNWSKCGRFFLKVRPLAGQQSAPIYRYCPDTDHRARALPEEARRRMQLWRKRKAKKHR